MNKKLLGFLLLFLSFTLQGQEAVPEIPVPDYAATLRQLELRIVDLDTSGRVKVEIRNKSIAVLKIWKEANSWGASRWRVLQIRNNSVNTFLQNPNRIFTKNGPDFDEIPAGGVAVRQLDLNAGMWCGLGTCSWPKDKGFGKRRAQFRPGDLIIVVYDVPGSVEAGDEGVWFGVAAASKRVK